MIMMGRMGKVHVPRASRVHDFTLTYSLPSGLNVPALRGLLTTVI